MIDGKQKFNVDKIVIKKTKWIRANEGGILINKLYNGKVVKKDDVVGELRNISGELITKIKMPNDGVILGMSKSSLIMSGDALYNLGFINDNLPEDEEFFDYFDFEM